MAGGKLSPRQKMINLMYLVFIAMLAMQMDKKVLSSFGFMKTKIEDANVSRKVNLDAYMASLQQKAQDQSEKYAPLYAKADSIRKLSNATFEYLESIKNEILAETAEEDKEDWESMSQSDRVDAMFFKGDKNTATGDEFFNKVSYYREQLLSIIPNEEQFEGLKTNIAKRFSTSPEPAKDGSADVPWLRSRYEGMPLVTSLANITQIQGDIRNSEGETYALLLGGQLEADSKLTTNNYTGIVKLSKSAFYSDENLEGQVVLGRYDSNLVPKRVMLNGKEIKPNIVGGQVQLKFPAGNIGDKEMKGSIVFMQDGEETEIPFETAYSVIAKPKEAVISADKMNVVYRGLDNPVSISLPGIADKDVKASAPGLRKTKPGKYIINPGAGKSVKITVTGKLGNGQKPITSVKTFRIKDIPAAAGTVRGDFGTVPMPKTSVRNITVGAALPDFVFDLQLRVSSFVIKVPGQPSVKVTGTKLNARAKKALAKAKRGDILTIFDIKATESKKGTRIKKVLPVNIRITN